MEDFEYPKNFSKMHWKIEATDSAVKISVYFDAETGEARIVRTGIDKMYNRDDLLHFGVGDDLILHGANYTVTFTLEE